MMKTDLFVFEPILSMASQLEAVSKNVCVLGGGQLGRMMGLEAIRLGINMTCLDPGGDDSAAAEVCTVVKGSFNSFADVTAMKGDSFTVEIEHVSIDGLEALEKEGIAVNPSSRALKIISDKVVQKRTLSEHGVPMGDFLEIPSGSDLIQSVKDAAVSLGGYPLMLKARKLAYDGRGNVVIKCEGEIAAAIQTLGDGIYAERWVPFQAEVACIVARDRKGAVVTYDVVETRQADNICRVVVVPPSFEFPSEARNEAERVARLAVSAVTGAGVFAVEMFYLGGSSILFNEMAPRPHNSGHLTIEACATSQFEQHLRCVANLPLGDTSLIVGAAAMVNILGAETEQATFASLVPAFSVPGASVHWYGKSCRPGRKLGHITVTAESMPELRKRLVLVGEPLDEKDSADIDPPLVGVIMGSDSDLPTMVECAAVLSSFSVPFEVTVVSAHRTPDRMYSYAKEAKSRGIKVIVAGAGGAAHLPGMVAVLTPLPVIGVPIKSSALSGKDSLLSIVQMPGGVPVATVAIGNAKNAGLLAVRMLAIGDSKFSRRLASDLDAFNENQQVEVLDKATHLEAVGANQYLGEYLNKDSTYKYMPRIRAAIRSVLNVTELRLTPKNGQHEVNHYVGKVRDRYDDGKHVVLITTDRLTAFDRPIAMIPFKGQVLNLVSLWWFKQTEHIVKNQLLSSNSHGNAIHPNVTLARRCKTFPIEFVMRGYIAGSSGTSLWTHYSKGVRSYCGFDIPNGLEKNQKLPMNLCTPTTKSDEHDELIDAETIVKDGWMTKEDWEFCSSKAYELFAFGQKTALKHGLILVDTKYEFGRDLETGEILLIDEIHTPDCSRYWVADTYDKCMAEGNAPEHIDKEFVRLWYTQHCDPYKDEILPEAPVELVCELSRRYLMLYEKITGDKFPFEISANQVNEDIQRKIDVLF